MVPSVYRPFGFFLSFFSPQETDNLCRCCVFLPCSENRSSQDSWAAAAAHHCALIVWIDSWCRPPTCNLIRSPVKHIPYSRVQADELQISARDWGLRWTRRRLPAARKTLCWRRPSPRSRGSTYHNSARETQRCKLAVPWNLEFKRPIVWDFNATSGPKWNGKKYPRLFLG